MKIAMKLYKTKNQLLSFISPTKAANQAVSIFLNPRRSQPKPWELKAETSGQRFKLNQQVSAIRWVPESNDRQKKQVLLVHGWESRATQMYGFVPNLLKQGYEVVAIDMPAHGLSSGVRSDAKQFADSILLAEKECGKFDIIIAHSMGAGATSHAVAKGLSSEKLVLISAASSIETILNRFGKFIGLNTKATKSFVNLVGEEVGVTASDIDSVTMAQSNSIPTLFIHDRVDYEVPLSEAEILLPLFKNSDIFITEGLGHRKILKSQLVMEKINSFVLSPSIA